MIHISYFPSLMLEGACGCLFISFASLVDDTNFVVVYTALQLKKRSIATYLMLFFPFISREQRCVKSCFMSYCDLHFNI